MDEGEFFNSEIFGAHWGMIRMPDVPKDEPEVVAAKHRQFIRGHFQKNYDQEVCLDIIA